MLDSRTVRTVRGIVAEHDCRVDDSLKIIDLIMLLFLLFLVFASKYAIISLPYYWDEMTVYVAPSLHLSRSHLLNALPGLHPAFMFYGHPFVLYIMLATCFKLFGESPETGHMFVLLITVSGLWFTYLLGTFINNRLTGFLACMLTFLTPLYFTQSGMVTGDIIMSALGVITVYMAVKDKYQYYFLFASLLLLTKESAIAIVFSISVYFFITAHKGKAVKYALPALVFILFFLAQHHFTGSWLPNKYFNNNDFAILNIHQVVHQFDNVTRVAFTSHYKFIPALLIVLCIFIYKKDFLKKEFLLFTIIFATFIIPFSFIYFLSRYVLATLPFYSIIAATAIVMLTKRWWMSIGVALIILSLFVTKYNGAESGIDSYEQTMQYVDVVKTHQDACAYIENNYSDKRILTVWPVYHELQDPSFGYVHNKMQAVYYHDSMRNSDYDLIVYCRQSERFNDKIINLARTRGMIRIAQFARNGKTAEIFTTQ